MTSTGEGDEPTPVRDGDAAPDAAARKAAKLAAKRAAKGAAKSTRSVRKAAEDAARAERKAVRKAKQATEREADRVAGAARKAAKAAKAEQKAARKASKAAAREAKQADRSGSAAAAAAETVLSEVAGLVRLATEPAASRIVQRVTQRAPQPEPEPEAEPEPVVPAAVEPDAMTQRAPEPEPVVPAAVEPEAVVSEPAAADAELAAPFDAAPIRALPEPSGESATAIEIPPGSLVGAAIDVGATSVHLLVGIVGRHLVQPLVDESVFLGLGDRVSTEGYLGPALREALVADLARYVASARSLGARFVTVVGTEPLRRAADAASVVHELEAKTGVALHVLDHEEEGLLTLVGVTGGRQLTGELLVVDIGGGSSELVDVSTMDGVRAVGLPLGAGRLTRSLVRSDPPSLAEIEALRVEVARIVRTAPDGRPAEIVAVGGTASNLLKLLPATAVDRTLTRRRLAVALAMLTVERSTEAAARHLIRPERARILPAGVIIVDAILDRYGLDRLRVSEAGIREGAILATATAGVSWRDRLGDLVRGWEEQSEAG